MDENKNYGKNRCIEGVCQKYYPVPQLASHEMRRSTCNQAN